MTLHGSRRDASTMIDVAVVGGGPAGLFVASRCARAGLDVVLFEEHRRIGDPTHCTGIVSAEIEEFVKIPDDMVLNRLRRARLVSPLGSVCEIVWQPVAGEEILVIDRGEFDRVLAADAIEHGVRVRAGRRVDDIAIRDDAVVLQCGGQAVRARMCVLACGVSYRFQRQLGLGLPSPVIHTAQTEAGAEHDDTVELHLGRTVAPDGFIWKVPLHRRDRQAVKIGIMARGDVGEYLGRYLARPEVRTTLRGVPGHPIRRLLPLGPILKTYTDRVLVAGDAGGFTKPTTGGGIFYSLVSATIATATVLEAFRRGRFDAGVLKAYEAEWQARLGLELRVGGWLRQIAVKCTDTEIDTIVRALGRSDVHALIDTTARFNWHRPLILSLARHPAIASILFRALLR